MVDAVSQIQKPLEADLIHLAVRQEVPPYSSLQHEHLLLTERSQGRQIGHMAQWNYKEVFRSDGSLVECHVTVFAHIKHQAFIEYLTLPAEPARIVGVLVVCRLHRKFNFASVERIFAAFSKTVFGNLHILEHYNSATLVFPLALVKKYL